MKRIKLLAVSIALGVTSSYAAIPFNGFYAGAQLGYTERAIKTDLNAQLSATGGSVNGTYARTKRSNGFLYALMAGYGQTINSLYFGLEASVQDDTSSRAHQKHPFLGTTVQTRYNRGCVFGLAPRVGYVFDKTNLVYAKFGFETSRDYMSHNADGSNGLQSAKSTKIVFVPGIGFEKAFGAILVRAEYGYNCGANLSVTRTETLNGLVATVSQKQKYTAHEFKIGAAYQF